MSEGKTVDECLVRIVEIATGAVVKEMGPMMRSRAEKVARGAAINMADEYTARVVSAKDAR